MDFYYISVKNLPILRAEFEGEYLVSLQPSDKSIKSVDLPNKASLLQEDLQNYCTIGHHNFATKIKFKAKTSFQLSVWKQLLKIPFGQTRTYQEIAISLGNPKKARAVGNAVNKNPILIIIPCHRVIGKNGTLTGFAYGLEIKQTLLQLEKQLNINSCF